MVVPRPRRGRWITIGTAIAASALMLGACGGSDSDLTELAQRGKETSLANGCASCHGAQGQGGVGPTWIDLAGSERELKGGTIVVADEVYLLRSILDPAAEEVAGYTLSMPVNGLSEEQAADVVAYIEELTTDAP